MGLHPNWVHLELLAVWNSEKKKSNIDGHGEIYDGFLITSCILLGICLGYYNLSSQPSVFQVNTFNSHKDVEKLQPNLQHIPIWGCPAHVLKPNVDKSKTRSEVC